MKMDELTIGEAKKLVAMLGTTGKADTFFEVGKNYLIRTVTMIQTGRLLAVNEQELLLGDAAWIADTGRFSDSLAKNEFNEVEPYHRPVGVGRGAIVDWTEIDTLPRVQK